MHAVRFAIYMLVSIAVYSAKQEPESGSVNRSVEESNPKIEVDHKGKETDGRIVRNRNREEQLKRELHARFKPSRLTYNKGLHFDVLQIRGKDLGQVNSQIDKGLEERITEYLSEINSPLGQKSSIEILQVYKINADVRKIRFRQTVNNIPLNDLSSIEIDSKGKVLNLNLWRIDEDELPPIMINEDQALQIAIDTVAKHFYADYITLGHKENKEDVNIQRRFRLITLNDAVVEYEVTMFVYLPEAAYGRKRVVVNATTGKAKFMRPRILNFDVTGSSKPYGASCEVKFAALK